MEELVRVLRKDRIIEDPYFDTYVCLDIETTSRPANRIIEIGAVKVIRGRVSKVYTRLVDPGMKIPREITRLTGITDSMVSGRRNIWQVLPELKEFIGSHIIVGHDVIQNDMKNLIAVGAPAELNSTTRCLIPCIFPGNSSRGPAGWAICASSCG